MTHKCVTIPINAIEQYVRGVLFNLLYKVFLTSKSVNETLVCDHLNESCLTVIHVVLFIMLYRAVLFSCPVFHVSGLRYCIHVILFKVVLPNTFVEILHSNF